MIFMSKGDPGGWLQPSKILAEKQKPSAAASVEHLEISPCP